MNDCPPGFQVARIVGAFCEGGQERDGRKKGLLIRSFQQKAEQDELGRDWRGRPEKRGAGEVWRQMSTGRGGAKRTGHMMYWRMKNRGEKSNRSSEHGKGEGREMEQREMLLNGHKEKLN